MQIHWQDLRPTALHQLIIEHQPELVKANLQELGISLPNQPSSKDLLKAIHALSHQEDYGAYAEQLTIALDVPLEEDNKGYDLLAAYAQDSLGAMALTNALIHAPIEQELISQEELYRLEYWSEIGWYASVVVVVLLILIFLMRK